MRVFKNVGKFFCAFIIVLASVFQHSYAHDGPVHVQITDSAFGYSSGIQNFLSQNLESQSLDASQPQCASPLSPLGWLEAGSHMEDDQMYSGWPLYLAPRALDHFYTLSPNRIPGQVQGITDPSLGPFVNAATGWGLQTLGGGFITNSFAWASWPGVPGPSIHVPAESILDSDFYFNISALANVGTNLYNWPCARAYECAALTNYDQSDRNAAMASMLYALGHVIHLNQDLTSPDHARDVNHNKLAYFENFGLANFTNNPQWFNLPANNATVGWLNWKNKGFSKLLDFWDRGLYQGGSSLSLQNEALGSLKLGLGEWSNGNFLGDRSFYNEFYTDPASSDYFHKFPFPSIMTSTTFPQVRGTLAYGVRTVLLKNISTNIATKIYLDKNGDGINFLNHSALNYLGSYSRTRGRFIQAACSINDSNVLWAYHSQLLPKAVEYSTGILDYFFRGTMSFDISTNDDTNYVISVENTSPDDFGNGVFSLYYQNTNTTREFIGETNFVGTFTSGSTMTLTFTNTGEDGKFLLVYQGSIGLTNGQAADPVDNGMAIATGVAFTDSSSSQATAFAFAQNPIQWYTAPAGLNDGGVPFVGQLLSTSPNFNGNVGDYPVPSYAEDGEMNAFWCFLPSMPFAYSVTVNYYAGSFYFIPGGPYWYYCLNADDYGNYIPSGGVVNVPANLQVQLYFYMAAGTASLGANLVISR